MSHHWQNLVSLSMKGTEKVKLEESNIPEELKQEYAQIQSTAADTEDGFLKVSALIWVYSEAGKSFPETKNTYKVCEEETSPYISLEKEAVLKKILTFGFDDLLLLFIEKCNEKQLVLPPNFLPTIFEKCKQYIDLREPFSVAMGKRGSWLIHLNEDWSFVSTQKSSEVWETGQFPERLQFMKSLRKSNPSKSVELLKASWKQDDVSKRESFLGLLKPNLSKDDIPFLEEIISKDKSDKIKKLALEFLVSIPDSNRADKIWEMGEGFFSLDKKGNFSFNPPKELGAELKALGIDESADFYGFTKDESWLYQILFYVHPKKLEEKLKLSPEAILEKLNGKKDTVKYIQPIVQSVCRIHLDNRWTKEILQFKTKNTKTNSLQLSEFSSLMDNLTIEDKEELFKKKIYNSLGYPVNVLNFLLNCKYPWTLDFSKKALDILSKEYKSIYYNKHDIYLLNSCIHPDILKSMDDYKDIILEEDYFNRLFNAIELRTSL